LGTGVLSEVRGCGGGGKNERCQVDQNSETDQGYSHKREENKCQGMNPSQADEFHDATEDD